MSEPWFTVASHFIGIERHADGVHDNADIAEICKVAGFPGMPESTQWCAAFVGASLRLSGFANAHTLLALGYKDGRFYQRDLRVLLRRIDVGGSDFDGWGGGHFALGRRSAGRAALTAAPFALKRARLAAGTASV